MSSEPTTLEGPDDLSERERMAVEAELRCLADDEFVMAERYVDWQVRGPTLEADLAIANIAQDEYGHARLWYDLLQDFDYEERELVWDRDPSNFRHATLVELTYKRGDWADCILRGYLYDHFEMLRLEALSDSAYQRIANRVGKVLDEEHYHRDHAQNWLERLTGEKNTSERPGINSERDGDAHQRLQAALDRLYPHALTLFAPCTNPATRRDDSNGSARTNLEESIVELGVRTRTMAELRDDWFAVTTSFLEGLGLTVPDDGPPTAQGRDGTHTEAWENLHHQLTYTYEMLGREPASLMADPDGADV